MRARAPFQADDLTDLCLLLMEAEEVVAMREIAAGERHPSVIGLRHDVDNTLEPSLELARWEHAHGFRATYFVLHDSPYWDSPELPATLEAIADLGHEIGIHTNALAVAMERGVDPDAVLWSALDRLRGWGHNVTGVVAHGDRTWCYDPGDDGSLVMVNDEHFTECSRPELGEPDRLVRNRGKSLRLAPRSLHEFGLRYESYRAGARALYLSDSGGKWNESYSWILQQFPHPEGQLHVLTHPCWWAEAFPRRAEVAA